MREDYREKLEEMFDRGFLIFYVTKDDSIHCTSFNPEDIDQIWEIEECIREFAERYREN